MFMVFAFSGRDYDFQNQLYLIWGASRYFKNTRSTKKSFGHVISEKLEMLEIQTFENVGNGGGRTKSGDPSNIV